MNYDEITTAEEIRAYNKRVVEMRANEESRRDQCKLLIKALRKEFPNVKFGVTKGEAGVKVNGSPIWPNDDMTIETFGEKVREIVKRGE